jgi:Txe/YoeB family toxin of Txe-Axe toxin-antitoxin module
VDVKLQTVYRILQHLKKHGHTSIKNDIRKVYGMDDNKWEIRINRADRIIFKINGDRSIDVTSIWGHLY